MKWNSELYDSKHNFVSEYGKDLIEFIPSDINQKILDLGCGTGTLTYQLSDKCSYILGVDSSADMIELAKKNYPSVDFKVMNILSLPFNREWDIIFSNAVFHWVKDHNLLVKNIEQSLKNGGKLICEFGAKGNISIIEKNFEIALKELGFEYNSKFNFPSEEEFKNILLSHNFDVKDIYSFDRPTVFNHGEDGLYNWAEQFFRLELDNFNDDQQKIILNRFEEISREELWNGSNWVGDYRRLRVIAEKI